ncbi:hypothetical protein SALCHL_001756 [Streptomyces albus subsp. chlorinus]|uniref:effector-associated constant component EACC1 n=1 Tax=Streptomyces albus TaxID=1888 RepID=UPI001570F03A|nr:hypothetical protein [Streptomyces albus]
MGEVPDGRGGSAVEVEISVAGGDAAATADLYRWLRDDPQLRRHAVVGLGTRQEADAPGSGGTGGTAMGAFEVVELVLTQGFSAANLALAYAAWRSARPAAPPLTVVVDGTSLRIEGGSPEELARLVRALSPVGPGGGGDADTGEHEGADADAGAGADVAEEGSREGPEGE